MSLTTTLAWRNVWRQPRRTVLTMLAVASSAAVLTFFIALQYSSYDTAINASTSIFFGHMQIQADGYLEKPQMRTSIKHPVQIAERVKEVPGVTAVGVRAFGFALASSEERTYGVQVVGVQPAAEPALSTIPGVLKKGAYLSSSEAHEVLVGDVLARNLKISVGDDLTLLGQGQDGSLAATVIPVVGIFVSGSQDIDRSMVHMPLSVFQETFSMPDNAHAIVMKTSDLQQSNELQKNIGLALKNFNQALVVLRWDQLMPGLKQSIELDLASSWLFYFSLIAIVCFTVLNTFLMSILERTHEFGVMLALGAKPQQIAKIVFAESLVLTVLGLMCGILLGGAITVYFWVYGFSIPGSEEIMKLWNLPLKIHPKLTPKVIIVGPGVILLSAMISVLLPIRRIQKLEAVEALRAA